MGTGGTGEVAHTPCWQARQQRGSCMVCVGKVGELVPMNGVEKKLA